MRASMKGAIGHFAGNETGDDSDPRALWHRIHAMLRSNVRVFTRGTIVLILLLSLLHIVYPSSIEWLNKLAGLPEPSAATVLALFVTIIILEKVFSIEDELLLNRKFEFGPQDDLYRKVIDEIVSNRLSANKVSFLQHSGQLVSLDICKLLRNARGIDVVLYQQTPHCASLHGANGVMERIDAVNAHLAYMDHVSEFKSHLKIKRFQSPASLRAIVVDDKLIVFSWYLHLKSGDDLKIIGSENTGIYITSDAPEFKLIHEMIAKSIKAYDEECTGTEEKLSENVTLQHC